MRAFLLSLVAVGRSEAAPALQAGDELRPGCLSVNGATLTMLRDFETDGQSTTRTMTYMKVQ